MCYKTGSMACIILLAMFSRLVPHPPNFTPMIAVALFAGATLSSRWLALLLPLAAMLLSDAALEAATRMHLLGGWLAMGHGFHRGMLMIYVIFALITAIGFLLRERKTVVAVSSSVLAASIAFFVLANFGVWAEGAIYPHTMDGLWQCYLAALPFQKWSLLGNAFYALVLFGGLALLEQTMPSIVLRPAASVR